MAKSLRKLLAEASELVAIVGLTVDKTSVNICRYNGEITFQMDALELARVSRQLEVPRKKIEISEHECESRISIHVDFRARGARWCAVIWKEKLPEFYAAMGVDPVRRLTVEPLALPGVPKRLTAEPKRLTRKPTTLFSEDDHG